MLLLSFTELKGSDCQFLKQELISPTDNALYICGPDHGSHSFWNVNKSFSQPKELGFHRSQKVQNNRYSHEKHTQKIFAEVGGISIKKFKKVLQFVLKLRHTKSRNFQSAYFSFVGYQVLPQKELIEVEFETKACFSH